MAVLGPVSSLSLPAALKLLPYKCIPSPDSVPAPFMTRGDSPTTPEPWSGALRRCGCEQEQGGGTFVPPSGHGELAFGVEGDTHAFRFERGRGHPDLGECAQIGLGAALDEEREAAVGLQTIGSRGVVIQD